MNARRLLCGALLGLAAGLMAGQSNTGAQRSSGRLDESGVGARDAAMANAVAAAPTGPSAVGVNPAFLAGQGLGLSLDQSNSVAYQRSLLSGAMAAGPWGSLGASLGYADFGSVNLADSTGEVRTIRPFQGSLSLGLGRAMGRGFSAGATVHALHQDFGFLDSYRSYGSTLGLAWRGGALSLGLAQSFESELDARGGVYAMRVGAAWDQAWLPSQSLLVSTELQHDYQGLRALRAGVENRSFGVFALRGGYDFEPAASGFDDFQGRWTAGLGIKMNAWTLDLSYGLREEYDSSQRATISWAP